MDIAQPVVLGLADGLKKGAVGVGAHLCHFFMGVGSLSRIAAPVLLPHIPGGL